MACQTPETPDTDNDCCEPEESGWHSLNDNDEAAIESYKTAEYLRNWGWDVVGAAEAYVLLEKNDLPAAGGGETVSINDDGVDFTHPELVDQQGDIPHASMGGDKGYTDSHGTHVAGIVAAERDETGMHGLAWQARLHRANWNKWEDIASAAEAGASVVNLSWSEGNTDKAFAKIEDDLDDYRSHVEDAVQANAILVAALGQGDEVRHGVPVLFANEASINGQMLVVGNVDANLDLDNFPCGHSVDAALEYCLVAPGSDILAPAPLKENFQDRHVEWIDGAPYHRWDGTSMATPIVAAAAAILRAAFPDVPPNEIVNAILETAQPLHEDGEDADSISYTYGAGLLDIHGAVEWLGSNTQ